MFDFKGKDKPITPTVVTVDINKEIIKQGFYLGYRIDHNNDFKLLGLFDDKTIAEMESDTYKNHIIDKYKKEDLTMSMFGASFAKKTMDEVMSHRIIFVPIDSSVLLNYDIKQVKEEPTEETK